MLNYFRSAANTLSKVGTIVLATGLGAYTLAVPTDAFAYNSRGGGAPGAAGHDGGRGGAGVGIGTGRTGLGGGIGPSAPGAKSGEGRRGTGGEVSGREGHRGQSAEGRGNHQNARSHEGFLGGLFGFGNDHLGGDSKDHGGKRHSGNERAGEHHHKGEQKGRDGRQEGKHRGDREHDARHYKHHPQKYNPRDKDDCPPESSPPPKSPPKTVKSVAPQGGEICNVWDLATRDCRKPKIKVTYEAGRTKHDQTINRGVSMKDASQHRAQASGFSSNDNCWRQNGRYKRAVRGSYESGGAYSYPFALN